MNWQQIHSRSSHRAPSFRFNPNEDDLIEEVIEQQAEELLVINRHYRPNSREDIRKEDDDDSRRASDVSDRTSLDGNKPLSQHSPLVRLAADLSGPRESDSLLKQQQVMRQTPTSMRSMLGITSSRLNKAKSLDSVDETNKTAHDSPSKWFNGLKAKIIETIEEKKRKNEALSGQSRFFNNDGEKEKEMKDFVTASEALADDFDDIEAAMELPLPPFAKEERKSSRSEKNSEESEKAVSDSKEGDKEDGESAREVDSTSSPSRTAPLDTKFLDIKFNNNKPTSTPPQTLPGLTCDSERREQSKTERFSEGVSEKEKSEMPSHEEVADAQLTLKWSFTTLYYIAAGLVCLFALLVTLTSPLPSFLNGFLFGGVVTFMSLSLLAVSLGSRYLVKKAAKKRRSASDVFVAKQSQEESLQKTWMYEYIGGDYENRQEIDREQTCKTQLVLVRLDGANIRISKPKHPPKKSHLDQMHSLPLFVSQRHFDLAKMTSKKLTLLLPKTVRNWKKYIWHKRYPFCLDLDEPYKSKSTRLILFARSCRDKEEWFYRMRDALDGARLSPPDVLSDPVTPIVLDAASPAEKDISRTHSMDFPLPRELPSVLASSPLSSLATTPSTPTRSSELLLSNRQIDYDTFMQSLLDYNIQHSLSSLGWFNAFFGRVFYAILTEKYWSRWVATKIQRKLKRIKLPYYIETLTLSEIDLGSNLPKFNNIPKAPRVDAKGLWIEFDITYSGGFTMTLETKLNLMKLKDHSLGVQELRQLSDHISQDIWLSDDSESIVSSSDDDSEEAAREEGDAAASKHQKLLRFVDKIASSPYFQKAAENKYIKRAMEGVSNCPLILTVQIQVLNGTLVFNIPPPPTDRLWYGFLEKNLDLVISARPKLGDHEVSITHVTEWIERKLRAEFAKVLVMPHMDDLFIPVLLTNAEQFITIVP